jgi:hypothetical protein
VEGAPEMMLPLVLDRGLPNGHERRPPGVWGAAVEIRDDRIIRQWSQERGWVEEPGESTAQARTPRGRMGTGRRERL